MSSATGAATESAVSITMPVLGDASQQVRWDLPTGRRQRESEEDADAGNVFAFQRPTTAVTETAASTTLVGASDRGQNFAEPPINGFTGGGKYDISHPAPFAGSHNINNSIFASGLRHRAKPAGEDPEGAVAELAFMNAADRTTRTHPLRPPPAARPETANTDWTEGSAYRPNMYTPSTIAGDATLADGKTTWGDGLGGQTKDDPDDPELFIEEDSPYAEVRAAVSNLDDRNMPALTLRAWVIGVVSTMLIAAANVFLMQRSPAPTIPVTALLVLVYPIGRFAAWLMPIRTYKLPKWLGGRPFSFNPCPFNVKEHTIIVMMANVAITPAYGLNSIIISEIFYKQVFPIAFAFLYILVSQVLGMTMAGVTRRFLVDPPSMLWPGVLVTTTTLNTLHAEADHTHGMTRLRFFLIVVAASFFYYFIPGKSHSKVVDSVWHVALTSPL
jgi:hypothetical protein